MGLTASEGTSVSDGYSVAQVTRVMRLMHSLRTDPVLLDYVLQIKHAFADEVDEDALALWSQLSEQEMTILWVAPKYGGIFTTDERKRLRPYSSTG